MAERKRFIRGNEVDSYGQGSPNMINQSIILSQRQRNDAIVHETSRNGLEAVAI